MKTNLELLQKLRIAAAYTDEYLCILDKNQLFDEFFPDAKTLLPAPLFLGDIPDFHSVVTGNGALSTNLSMMVNGRKQIFSLKFMQDEDSRYIFSAQNLTQEGRSQIDFYGSDQPFIPQYLMKSAPMLLIDAGLGGRILDANDAACLFYGYTKQEIESLTIDQINMLSPEAVRKEMAQAALFKRNYFNFKHRLKNGHIKDVEVYSSPVPIRGKTLLFSIVIDASERKMYEMLLADLNARINERVEAEKMACVVTTSKYQNLFEMSQDAVIIIEFSDKKQVVLADVNKSACNLFGFSKDELLTKKPADLIYDNNEFNDYLQRQQVALDSAGIHEGRLKIVRSDGKIRTVETTVRQTYMLGKPVVIAVLRDITEKLNREKELMEKNMVLIQQKRMVEMGGLLSAAVHQMKQPLSTISLVAEVMRDEPDNLEENSAILKSQVKYLNETLTEFRNYFSAPSEKTVFTVLNVANEVANIATPLLAASGISVTVSGDESVQSFGQQGDFKQIMMNLVMNSMDVIKERGINKGRIDIDVHNGGSHAVIMIADNGGGIDEKLLPEEIFKPFFSTKGENGTGIGLSIVRGMAEKLGGYVKAENTPSGAIFTVAINIVRYS
jgi:PAS domain S-box-containing protein